MIQTIAVVILLVLSVAYLLRKLKQEFSGKGSCESCGCSVSSVDTPENHLEQIKQGNNRMD